MQPLSFGARFAFAFAAFFRVLFDGAFAARALAARTASPRPEPEPPAAAAIAGAVSHAARNDHGTRDQGALLLLSIFQREGRLVDFLMQDITAFSDADVGAAARLVHEGSSKALRARATVSPIRSEVEGAPVAIAIADASVKLVGNLTGAGPYHGTLRHKGWQVASLSLPTPTSDYDAAIVQPAEVAL